MVGIDRVVDLLGRLPHQEQAAGDQDQVAPGEAVAEGGEQRLVRLTMRRWSTAAPGA
jgi:hypothetical protein